MAESGLFVKFDPEKISGVATNLEFQHKRLIQNLANIKRKAENLKANWQGDSAELYMKKIKEFDTQGTEMAKIFLAFSQDLASASGIYKTGETQAKQKAEALPTDGVFLV